MDEDALDVTGTSLEGVECKTNLEADVAALSKIISMNGFGDRASNPTPSISSRRSIRKWLGIKLSCPHGDLFFGNGASHLTEGNVTSPY